MLWAERIPFSPLGLEPFTGATAARCPGNNSLPSANPIRNSWTLNRALSWVSGGRSVWTRGHIFRPPYDQRIPLRVE
jgi:hypothetical protein